MLDKEQFTYFYKVGKVRRFCTFGQFKPVSLKRMKRISWKWYDIQAPSTFLMNYNMGETSYNPAHHTTMHHICPTKTFTHFSVLIQTCHNSYKMCILSLCKVKSLVFFINCHNTCFLSSETDYLNVNLTCSILNHFSHVLYERFRWRKCKHDPDVCCECFTSHTNSNRKLQTLWGGTFADWKWCFTLCILRWINALEELLIAIHVNVVKCNVKCHP